MTQEGANSDAGKEITVFGDQEVTFHIIYTKFRGYINLYDCGEFWYEMLTKHQDLIEVDEENFYYETSLP